MFLVIYMEIAAASLHHHHHHHPLKLRDNNNNSNNEFFYSWKQSIIGKRKSAVELLQETKPLYVKSETVLDRKQQLGRSYFSYSSHSDDDNLLYPNDNNNAGGPPTTCPTFGTRSFTTSYNNSSLPNRYAIGNSTIEHYTSAANYTSTLPIPKSPKLIPPPPAFRKSTGSFQLQNNLRKLLNVSKEDLLLYSKENISECDVDDSPFFEDDLSGNTEMRHYPSPIKSNKPSNRCTVSNCHKSLPDLSNTHVILPPVDDDDDNDGDENERCHLSLYSDSADGPNKSSQHHIDSISISSCRNDRLFITGLSKNCCVSKEENGAILASDNKLYPDVISPPSLYSDFKIKDIFPAAADNSKSCSILRSKSDVGSRKPSSSLKPIEITLQDPANLNNFFDNLGMNLEDYNLLTAPRSDTSSPVYFSSGSNSSLDSIGGRASGGEAHSINYNLELPSIVERNARIIKWLCNCRKAMEQVPSSNHRITIS